MSGAPIRTAALDLEDFSGLRTRKSAAERAREAQLAEARGEGRAEGYAEGLAAATEKAETEERAAIAALLEQARDLDLARADARAAAIAALAPVASALARLAAPRAAARGLAEELAAAVTARLDAAPSEALEAHVAPSVRDAVAAKLEEAVPVRADPALGETQARLDWPGGGLRFDAEDAAAAALDAIERFFGSPAAAQGAPKPALKEVVNDGG
jgi:hypothetical protein